MLIFTLVTVTCMVFCLYREYLRADLLYGDIEYKPLINNAKDHKKKLSTTAAVDYTVTLVLIIITGAFFL